MITKKFKRFILIPVILSGGSGTRLWPLSRKGFPKQFLSFLASQTLFQSTLTRLSRDANSSGFAPIVVCNEQHRFTVAEQLQEIGAQNSGIILESDGRNTAPAVAVAALHALAVNPNAVMLVLPADHVIKDEARFYEAMLQAKQAASEGRLVTFGIVPTSPQTGFGYIKASAKGEGFSKVDAFVEKPDEETAASYVASGDYYWNSGMFAFRADVYLKELAHYRPDIYDASQKAYEGAAKDMDFIRLDKEAFLSCPDESIDYAVMEKTDQAVVMPLDAGWSDVGSWSAIWEVSDKDEKGNTLKGDVLLQDTQNSLLFSEERLVAAVGVKDIILVETKDAVMVAHKDCVQDVKKIVQQLKAENRPEADWHRQVYRPWGCYDSIDSDERFQVKRITVKPGATLSLQKHHHRAEHWIVVSGTAEVTCDDKVFLLTENQSTYIPLGSTHRLSNPGKVPLLLIEVQSGSYLGEDDIVRFEDQYGRNTPES